MLKRCSIFYDLKKSKKFKSLNNKAKIYVSKIFKESSGIKGCKKCGEKIKLTFCINFSLIIKATSLFRIQFSDNDRFYSNSIQLTPDKVKFKYQTKYELKVIARITISPFRMSKPCFS